MKKVLVILITLVTILTLTGCTKENLENNYFENAESDSIDEAMEVFKSYLQEVKSNFEISYPKKHTQDTIWYDNSYINLQLFNKDKIYRHELINYHLSDDRNYMSDSTLYRFANFSISKSTLYNFGEVQENELVVLKDYEDKMKYSLKYLVDGSSVFIEYTELVGEDRYHQYTFYFYLNNQNEKVMDASFLNYSVTNSDEFSEKTFTKVIIGKCEESYSIFKLEEIDYLQYIYMDIETTDFTQIKNIDTNHIVGVFYNGESQELYDISYNYISDNYFSGEYSKFLRNVELVSYSDIKYQINLSEVLGWDNIMKKGTNYSVDYNLYNGEKMLSDVPGIRLEFETGEYVYYKYQGEDFFDTPTEEAVTLELINLDSGYTTDFFLAKIVEGNLILDNYLMKHNLNHTYEENYEIFFNK